MNEVGNCPFCGEPNPSVWQRDDGWCIKCVNGCSVSISGYDSNAGAVRAWNKRPGSESEGDDPQVAYIAAIEEDVEQLRGILNRIIRRYCGTCKWFYRYTTDPCRDVGHCNHPSPVEPKRAYHDDDFTGSLVDEDTCDQWQHRDTEIAAVLC